MIFTTYLAVKPKFGQIRFLFQRELTSVAQGYSYSVLVFNRADSQVQQVYSLDLASQREHNKAVIAETIKQQQARPGDTGSTPVQGET